MVDMLFIESYRLKVLSAPRGYKSETCGNCQSQQLQIVSPAALFQVTFSERRTKSASFRH
ncbi:hypothetical protein HED55_15710 [Ochrobactrum haematophilum]|uniref:Transposase n=1 Tax=Brucella haematophila TaxID=419474 RepID=A0ABX1DMK0_9HYPH|nr:hypothetical protein [Brucella haematophila]